MAVNLYLKYFHSGKDLGEMLTEVETENKSYEEGTASSEHIDQLHLDEKEEGGIDTVISIPFTTKSYRLAKRPKTKGKLYEKHVQIRQDKYSNSGNAWKVWDSGLVLARWVFSNGEIFRDKVVHEIGSGCGLTGIVTSPFCKRVIISDYKEAILDNIRQNVKLNEMEDLSNVRVTIFDFEKASESPSTVNEEDKADVVLGSDIIYGLHLAEWVPRALDAVLREGGVFYGVMPKNRWGVDEFRQHMEKLGFECVVRTHDEKYCEDFSKKSCWDFFTCTRKAKTES